MTEISTSSKPSRSPTKTTTKPHAGIVNAGSRPYRSHKIRACDLCRKRKSRCTVDIPGQSCLLCRVQGADCHYQEDPPPDEPGSIGSGVHRSPSQTLTGQKRKRDSESGPDGPDDSTDASGQADRGVSGAKSKDEDPQNESVLIVGPVAADDAQVIEKFSEQSNKPPDKGKKPYKFFSNDPRKPILYTTVSRRRQGVRQGVPPGDNQREILEQILGPFRHDLVKL